MKNRHRMPLLALAATIFLFSCGSNQGREEITKTIRLDINAPTSTDLPEVEISSIIPLDSRQAALFGNLKWYEVHDDKIYVLSSIERYSLFAFSLETGELIATAESGQGPAEINRPTACYIDKSSDKVLLYDETSGDIVFYDLNLNFLSKKRLQESYIDDFIVVDGDRILTSSDFTPDFCFRLYAEDNSLINKYVKGRQIRDGTLSLMKSLTKNRNGETFLITPFDYNIYKYENEQIKSLIFLDFGKHQLNEEDLSKRFTAIISMVREGSRVISPMSISLADDDILIRVFHGSNPIYYLLNLNSYELIRLNDLTTNAKLPEFIDISIMDDGAMYGVVEPLELKRFIKKSDGDFTGNFDFDPVNNPFLVKFRLLK